MPRKKRLEPWKHCVAGITAGSVSTALMHPLDLVRTRYQVYDKAAKTTQVRAAGPTGAGRLAPMEVVPGYRSFFHAVRTIFRGEGLSALYQGISPAMFGSAVSWGLYFFFYENAKKRYRRWSGADAADSSAQPYHLPVKEQLLSATEAGVTTVLITNPIWLAKTRLQIQINKSSAQAKMTAQHSAGLQPYRGLLDTFRTIVREEGFFGLYRGVSAALILTSHGTIQFFAYEYLKEFAVRMRESQRLGHFDPLWIGSLSKLAASTTTYPYQVMKARIQQRQIGGVQYNDGILACARTMLAREGWTSFYKGIGINTMRVIPQSAIIFYTYETVASIIGNEGSK